MPKITNHFDLHEFTESATARRLGISNMPVGAHLENVKRLAEVMEQVRTALGDRPIFITSGYRSPAVNAAVGGVPNSAHALGLAADFIAPNFGTPQAIAQAIEPFMAEFGIDQLIYEDKDDRQWVHLGLSENEPRHMAFTSTNSGDTPGFGDKVIV